MAVIQLEFRPRDLWVGAFWKTSADADGPLVNLWVCLLPCLPLHVAWRQKP